MKFFRGVVEDNKNSDSNGRVKVRIYGIHTENNENSSESFEYISTDNLPWAEVMGGTEFGLVSGFGISSVLRQGTLVWIVLDNDDPNKPIIIGTISGKFTTEKKYSDGEGFCDPDGEFPNLDRIGEYDLNELTRGQIKNTVIANKNDSLDISDVYTEIAQIESVYPHNNVVESFSGHIIEIDDTPDNERVQIIDKQGNYSEIKLKEYITKAVNKKVNLIMEDLLEHVGGGVKQQIDMDYFKTIAGYFKIQADGNLQIINDVKITGGLQVTDTITSDSDITSKAEVADSQGNLSSLRDAYDIHYHIGNLGVKTATPTSTDPKTRTSDFTWSNSPLGFKY